MRYTGFRWRGIVYKYLCVMFVLGPSARVFTQMVAALIRGLKETFGILLVAYIDNLLIQAMDKQTCRYHAKITILVLQGLGYRACTTTTHQ